MFDTMLSRFLLFFCSADVHSQGNISGTLGLQSDASGQYEWWSFVRSPKGEDEVEGSGVRHPLPGSATGAPDPTLRRGMSSPGQTQLAADHEGYTTVGREGGDRGNTVGQAQKNSSRDEAEAACADLKGALVVTVSEQVPGESQRFFLQGKYCIRASAW